MHIPPILCAALLIAGLQSISESDAASPGAAVSDPAREEHLTHQRDDTLETKRYRKSAENYVLPEVPMITEKGEKIRFPQDLDDGRPVILDFIFASCSAICPMLSQTFSRLQQELGAGADRVRLVSISIDPEQDTPERLRAYARRYRAGPQWSFYTGTREASLALQKAFHAFYVDKMNHRPLFFLRKAPGQPWVRLEGFVTPNELLEEYRQLSTKP